MKTNLFIAALSLVVLAGCSGEDEIGTLVAKSDNAITFGTYVGKQTKANEKDSFKANDTFGVLGYYAVGGKYETFSANFMSQETMTMQEGGTWSYANTKYWPNNTSDRISFVAYYPTSITPSVAEADGSISTSFTVNNTPSEQSDFMWSSIKNASNAKKTGEEINGKQNDSSTGNNVAFKFQHALSKVVFNAKLDKAIPTTGTGESVTPVATVSITEISIAKLANQGTFTIANDLKTGSWAATPTGEQAYTIFQAKDSDPKPIDVTSTTATAAIGESLLTIPQSVSGKTITVKYNVTYKQPSLTVPNEVTITMPNDATWASNTIYTYTLKISLTEVSMETGFEDWGTSPSDL